MSYNVHAALENELESGEELLWSGQPKQGVLFRGADAFLIPFSLMWGGFAIFWEFTVVTSDAGPFFVLWGIPFVLIGLYFIFGRFFVEAKQREKTIYGITNDRIIIITGLLQTKLKSLMLRSLSDVSLSESGDGSGTISFGNAFPMAAWFSFMAWPGTDPFAGPRFERVENAKQVYQVIREAQRNAT